MTSTPYFFERALLPAGWANGVRVSVAADGTIEEVATNIAPQSDDAQFGTAIPGIPNTHSHAFQRAMAGLSEHRVHAKESFWTWRETMYRLANRVTPADLRSIATQLYIEMVKAGYTSVAEFHYLHHRPDGQPYEQLSEMSAASLDAANVAGIGVTHLPVLYMRAGFGQVRISTEQRRFCNSVDQYLQLYDEIETRCRNQSQQRCALAFHSLRAVPHEAMTDALNALDAIDAGAPIHLHIAEQTLEVEQCVAELGARPVQWLHDNFDVNDQWCLVHATHLNDAETELLAKTGAVVAICPTTEANLGDGVFPLRQFLRLGGRIAVGSDSNSSVSPVEELRWLEYVQRLGARERNIVSDAAEAHTGNNLVERCLSGGAQALGQRIGKLEEGYRADIVVLDDDAPILCETGSESLLDSWVFSGNQCVVKDVMIAGGWWVNDFRHRNETDALAKFKKTLNKLR